jgi:putative radical SAM enzyme (TIGR03279 family)
MRRLEASRPLTVLDVAPGSPADHLGLRRGDAVLSVNGRPIRDAIDYQFHMADDEVSLEVRSPQGRERVLAHVRQDGEDFGLVFEELAPRECANRCIFCFVDQNPRGMRPTVYIRDEDYRFSFLFGHFITLTNLSEEDFARIIEQRLSPLYVSVHSTNPVTRQRLLRRKKGVDVMPPLKRLTDAGIEIHTQVVVCPGINDGDDLERTVEDLASLYPAVGSLAIVPVGLTQHREKLAELRPVTAEYAFGILPVIEQWRERLRARLGVGFAYLADEWFRILDLDPPSRAYYDDFPLLENGVGMTRQFIDEVLEDGPHLFSDIVAAGPRRVTCVTGTMFAKTLREVLATAPTVPKGIRFDVLPVENRFYGASIHVAGLLVGGDIREALLAENLGDIVCLPPFCLNPHGIFLDDVTIGDLARDVGRDVYSGFSPFEEQPGWIPQHSLHGA